jgi:hypothetical protein
VATNTYKYIYLVLGILIIGAGGFAFYIYEQSIAAPQVTQPASTVATGTPQFVENTSSPTDASIAQAYTDLYSNSSTTNFTDALQTLVTIAADDKNTNAQRAEALNGINYAYTQSDFDAGTIRDVVFSKPPFSTYYSGSNASSTDPLHPTSGPDVAAVEAALVKLNELSNALIPNHYALSRIEISMVFAFQRAAVGLPVAQQKSLKAQYGKQMEPVAAAYDALAPLDSSSAYPLSMRLQIMFAHASALAFIGQAENDPTYLDRGEALFQQTIQLGDSYTAANPNSTPVLNQTLLARIFYAAYYWGRYKTSNPALIENVLLPLTDVATIQNTTVYKTYLPSNKNTNVGPFTILRAIALQMPALKTFLQGEGWKF